MKKSKHIDTYGTKSGCSEKFWHFNHLQNELGPKISPVLRNLLLRVIVVVVVYLFFLQAVGNV